MPLNSSIHEMDEPAALDPYGGAAKYNESLRRARYEEQLLHDKMCEEEQKIREIEAKSKGKQSS